MSHKPEQVNQDAAQQGGLAVIAPSWMSEAALHRPSQYRVLLINDDFTPVDLVVTVLQKFFAKTLEEASSITMLIHENGAGVCGVYPHEIAETKVIQVMEFARRHGSPLLGRIEKDT